MMKIILLLLTFTQAIDKFISNGKHWAALFPNSQCGSFRQSPIDLKSDPKAYKQYKDEFVKDYHDFKGYIPVRWHKNYVVQVNLFKSERQGFTS